MEGIYIFSLLGILESFPFIVGKINVIYKYFRFLNELTSSKGPFLVEL